MAVLRWEAVVSAGNAHGADDLTTYWRAAVPGGWVLRSVSFDDPCDSGPESVLAPTLVFIPDPEHAWGSEVPR
jgi:hypothetical protein